MRHLLIKGRMLKISAPHARAVFTLFVLSISSANAGDPCPKKYWGPQVSNLSEIKSTPPSPISLKDAADFVINPHSRPELVGYDNDCGSIAWYESRRLDGYLEMYLATKNKTYLKAFVKTADRIYEANDIFSGKKDELRNKVVFGWSSLKYTAGGERHTHGVQSGILSEMYGKFSRIVIEEGISELRNKANDYNAIATKTLDVAWSDWNSTTQFFHFRPKAHKYYTVYPYNQGLAIGSAFLEQYRIAKYKGDVEKIKLYKDIIIRIGSYFKKSLQYDSSKNRYLWKYAPGSYYEDMSHASLDMNFILSAYEAGLLFTKTDMERFANTLFYTYDSKENKYARYMNGKDLPGYTNWHSLTCLMIVDFTQFRTDDLILRDCVTATRQIISNKNTLMKLDAQFFGLLVNGIPKLYRTETLKSF
jgi:hypothetical protein